MCRALRLVMALVLLAPGPAPAGAAGNTSSGFSLFGGHRKQDYEATPPPPAAPPRVADGSIFDVSAGYAPLIEGNRARRVGDIITVILTETTSTAKSALTKTQRGGSESLTPPTVGPFAFNANALNAGATSSFNGQGNTTQTNSLNGTIAVTIAEVRPNGTVLVRGEKQMLLSQGNEWIRVSGLVRVADIDPTTDTVASAQIADAHIEYSGKGSIQRSAREGWLSRVFNIVSPF